MVEPNEPLVEIRRSLSVLLQRTHRLLNATAMPIAALQHRVRGINVRQNVDETLNLSSESMRKSREEMIENLISRSQAIESVRGSLQIMLSSAEDMRTLLDSFQMDQRGFSNFQTQSGLLVNNFNEFFERWDQFLKQSGTLAELQELPADIAQVVELPAKARVVIAQVVRE